MAAHAFARHALATEAADHLLEVLDCHGARFEVTGGSPAQLPRSLACPVRAVATGRLLGWAREPPTPQTSLGKRLHFLAMWLLAADLPADEEDAISAHIVAGGGDDVTLRLWPTRAYACAVGARLRTLGAQPVCGTVMRILPDARVVLRVDNSKEQLLVDAAPGVVYPLTLLRELTADMRLLVQRSGGCVEASVAELRASHFDLNEFNHGVLDGRFASLDDMESARTRYLTGMMAAGALVEDAITGKLLRIRDQLIYVKIGNTAVSQRHAHIRDVQSLVNLLLEPSPRRVQGAHTCQPVLIVAPAGTGKTWMTRQAVYFLSEQLLASRADSAQAKEMPLVPLVISQGSHSVPAPPTACVHSPHCHVCTVSAAGHLRAAPRADDRQRAAGGPIKSAPLLREA